MKMSKRAMADKLGYEYLGKGIDDTGEDGFVIREYGTTRFLNIGQNMEQAEEWLIRELDYREEEHGKL